MDPIKFYYILSLNDIIQITKFAFVQFVRFLCDKKIADFSERMTALRNAAICTILAAAGKPPPTSFIHLSSCLDYLLPSFPAVNSLSIFLSSLPPSFFFPQDFLLSHF